MRKRNESARFMKFWKQILSGILAVGIVGSLTGCFSALENNELPTMTKSESAHENKTDSDTNTDVNSGSNSEHNQDSDNNQNSETDTNDNKTSENISIAGLSAAGDGYEGTKGTGNFNYGEALQKSLIFYELQRSGQLPSDTRTNWRGDSCLSDGADVGLDLTGGLFDAGDNVKFNLPMAYTASILGWSILEDYASYEESKQIDYALNNVRYICDYLMRCHPQDEVYYYQVGSGSEDHSWWGPAECVELRMNRPSYVVTADAPGSTVTAETAAALAVASILYAKTDAQYSEKCLSHAKSLYNFSAKYKSDAGYTAASGFYDSHSGFYDELSFAAVWLYYATTNQDYLTDAKNYYKEASQDYDWALCWDDVHIASALLLTRITNENIYRKAVEKHLDYWTIGTDGERITYTPKGLAWLDSWGSLRYATTTAFVAALYCDDSGCASNKRDDYWNFAVAQADYALGSTGFSYMVGFGDSYPEHVHHRTAQGSATNNMNEPSTARHTLYGALVGGPDASDGYTDVVSNFNTNEVACDYNAGFTGLLARLYREYKGQTIKNFGAMETPKDEFVVEAAINASGTDFMEIKTMVYNESAWPARGCKSLEVRYFVNLTEIYEAGGSVADVTISTNYMQNASADHLVVWDEANHIYYLSIAYEDDAVYPGGQESYRKEAQVRMRSEVGVWDDSNDPSFEGLVTGTLNPGTHLAVYESGKLVYGSEPGKGEHAGEVVTLPSGDSEKDSDKDSGNEKESTAKQSDATPLETKDGSVVSGDLKLSVQYTSSEKDANSISATLTLTNQGTKDVDLSKLALRYYLTNDSNQTYQFDCYYAGMNSGSGQYSEVKNVKAVFVDTAENDSDTLCEIQIQDGPKLDSGGSVSLNICIHYADWSVMKLSNDYSYLKAENIVIISE